MDSLLGNGLPSGWATARLAEIIEVPETVEPASAFRARETFAYISLTGVEPGRITAAETLAPAAAPSRARPRIREGDTLFSCVRVYLEKIVQVPESLDGEVCSTAFAVLRPKLGIDPRYLYWLVRRPEFIMQAEEQQRGNSPPAVQEGELRSFMVPVAPTEEQARIAAVADAAFKEVEAGEAALARAREGLVQFRASLLHAACTGALTAEWRAGDRPAGAGDDLIAAVLEDRKATWTAAERTRRITRGRLVDERAIATRYGAPLAPDVADLPALPDGWRWTSLDALIVSGPQNGLYLPQTAYGDGTPIVRIDDFQDGWARRPNELQRVACDSDVRVTYKLDEQDLVINRVNSMTHLGKMLLVPDDLAGALFESNMMRMRLSRHVNAAYVLAYLQSPSGRGRLIADAKWAVNQASINQTDVRRTPIPLPPRAEQDEIASRVQDALKTAVELRAEIDGGAAATTSLRQSVLHAAFTGRLVPQDPADEPAAALLARLRAAPATTRRPRKRGAAAQRELIETRA